MVIVAPSLHEYLAQIGAMDGRVAQIAGLILLGLVMRWPQRAGRRSAVTLQAQQVDLGYAQEARIGRAVRRVATHAPFGLYRHVLVDERALLLGVALVADGIASGSGPHLAQGRGAMHAVTITAGDEPLVYAMVIGTGKLGAGRGMASVTKFGLGLDQQLALLLGVMRTVAIETTDVVAGMSGRAKVLLLAGLAVALETPPARFGTRQVCETDDFAFVATACHMLGARAVAGFTAVAILLERLKMRRAFELLFVDALVTSQANVGTGILRRISRLAVFASFVGGHGGRCEKGDNHKEPNPKCRFHEQTPFQQVVAHCAARAQAEQNGNSPIWVSVGSLVSRHK